MHAAVHMLEGTCVNAESKSSTEDYRQYVASSWSSWSFYELQQNVAQVCIKLQFGTGVSNAAWLSLSAPWGFWSANSPRECVMSGKHVLYKMARLRSVNACLSRHGRVNVSPLPPSAALPWPSEAPGSSECSYQ